MRNADRFFVDSLFAVLDAPGAKTTVELECNGNERFDQRLESGKQHGCRGKT